MRASTFTFLFAGLTSTIFATDVNEFDNADCSGDAKFPHDLGIFFSASSASIDDTTQCIDVKGDDVFAYEGELDKNDDNCIGTLLGTLPEAKVKPDEFISGKRVTCVTLETPR
ncbi:hypothetical protein J7T55_005527 [Diaporthe amygdali]|uniref:uncharacterized protein n=1 Tax=Phomopsis amygdali TaxID=1214568 RepID=UPI0022FEA36B|nr:uncharacterized protein J7T55_005527 [Diaporthe amygdali]KAJ0108979.1 hypothetical protein J7T55_005527 [Diaporthe amygdali]